MLLLLLFDYCLLNIALHGLSVSVDLMWVLYEYFAYCRSLCERETDCQPLYYSSHVVSLCLLYKTFQFQELSKDKIILRRLVLPTHIWTQNIWPKPIISKVKENYIK